MRGIQDPRQNGRIVTDNLDVRPTARSFAPAPERGAQRSEAKSRNVVVRTEPDFRSRGDRYTPITNPSISVPRSRTEQPARNLQSTPSISGRSTQDVPSRVYQVPQSRTTTSQPAAARPSYGQQGRDTPVMQGQRQDTTQRTQQAPASRPSSRMDTAPPISRSSSGSSNGSFSSSGSSMGGYSGGSYSGGSSSVSSSGDSGRVMSGSSSPASSADRSSVSRSSGGDVSRPSSGSAAPPSSAPPASSSGSAVKKMPERPVAQNYAPRSYQAPRDSQPSRAFASQAQSYVTPAARSTSGGRPSVGSSPSYSSPAVRSSYSGGGSASMRSAPQSSAPRMAATPTRPSGGSGISTGMQRSASSGASSSPGRRK
jgi:hypothetical protein